MNLPHSWLCNRGSPGEADLKYRVLDAPGDSYLLVLGRPAKSYLKLQGTRGKSAFIKK